MAITAITDEFTLDITITRARYAELIKAEHDAECLKDLIYRRYKHYTGIDFKELKTLHDLYFVEGADE